MATKKKGTKKKAAKKESAKPVAKKKAAPAGKKASPRDPLDLSPFPPESLTREERWLCLACTLDIFTRHLGIPAAKAQGEIKRYQPGLEELGAPNAGRPYFRASGKLTGCPHCAAPPKWQAPLAVIRIEGGKATDALRRELVKGLPEGEFYVLEEKSTQKEALFDWLAKTGAELDPDSPGWLLEAARHWLGRRVPKHDWAAEFKGVHAVRRSRMLGEGHQREGARLFLPPQVYDEILLIQYLLSRSHKAGGLTFEGRFTLPDLIYRLRGGGYLRAMGIAAGNPSDILEQLTDLLGGEGRMKYHYVVDRRQFLARLQELKAARVPKPKL